MTCDLRLINEIKNIRPIPIGLPNWAHSLATKKGTLTSKGKVSFKNVSYVPELNYNMLSAAKLCRDLNYNVTFFDDSCVLQDPTLRIPIGVGEQKNGVYYYSGAQKVRIK